VRVANAPCSWGVLEFESASLAPSPDQVLDEISATGYEGTELGDWGFFATDPARLAADLAPRRLALAGAFVDVALTNPAAHGEGEKRAVRVARLLADTVRLTAFAKAAPPIVLSDATARVAERTAKAGRITPDDALAAAQWDHVAAGTERIARAVRDETGLRTVFHHHCATYVEAPTEIDTLMQRTSSTLVGLCLDTGHATYGGGNAVALADAYADRIWHVHFKDCSADLAARARAEAWTYLEAVRQGIFCELGRGQVDFAAVLDRLRAARYDGWIVVEQDRLPSASPGAEPATPAASAGRNRRFLAQLGV
jgi:inosose dehydratase